MVNASVKNHAVDMTTGAEWKRIIVFALPIMLGQLMQQLYATVDGIIVGNFVSSGALAAVGSCTTMSMLFIAVSVGMSTGSCIVISQFFGAGREKDMRAAAANVLLLMTGLGLFITLLAALTAGFTTSVILGIGEAAIQQQAEIYLRIYAVGLIFTFLYNAVAAILRAVGDSRAVLYFLLVSTIVNTVLDLLFVVTFRWGVAGAAWATVISQLACVSVSILYMFRRYPIFCFRNPRELKYDKVKMRLCLRMGIPSTLQQLTISCGHVLIQRLVNSFGETTMAAVTVGSRYDHYCSIPIMGMMQSCASFAGQNTGAGRLDRVKRGLFSAVIMDLVIVLVVNSCLYIFAEPLAALFGVEGEALKRAVEYIRFLCVAFIVFSVYIPFNGTFQGCGEPFMATLVSVIALGTRVSISYLMILGFHAGYQALWNPSYLCGWGCSLIVAVVHFATGKWKTKSLVHRSETESKPV